METSTFSKTKKYGILIGIIILALLIGSFFLPNTVSREASIELSTPHQYLTTLLKNNSTIPHWYPKFLERNDIHNFNNYSDSIIAYTTDEQSGFITSFEFQGDSCQFVDNKTNFIIKSSNIDSTKSVLIIKAVKETGYFKNLWNFITGFKLKSELKSIGKNIEKEIKKRSETNTYYNYTVEQVSMNRKHFILLKSNVQSAQKMAYYSQNITSVYQSAQDASILTTNSPTLLNYSMYNSNPIEIAAAIETVIEVNIKGLDTQIFENGLALKISVAGPRDNFTEIYKAFDEYAVDRSLKINSPIIEEFVTNPVQEADQSKWKTNIFAYFSSNK